MQEGRERIVGITNGYRKDTLLVNCHSSVAVVDEEVFSNGRIKLAKDHLLLKNTLSNLLSSE